MLRSRLGLDSGYPAGCCVHSRRLDDRATRIPRTVTTRLKRRTCSTIVSPILDLRARSLGYRFGVRRANPVVWSDEVAIGEKFRALAGEFNERQRRLWAASEARAAGRGGIAATSRATGISAPTIRKGIAEIDSGEHLGSGRVRRPGGGRHALTICPPDALEGSRGAG